MATGLAVATVACARAQDAALVVTGPDELPAANPERFLLFTGIDFCRASAAIYGGLHWAPGGLDDDGPVARLLLSRSVERYGATSTLIFRASALGGARFKAGRFELKLMTGPQLESNAPTSPQARLRGSRIGLQAIAESWWEPTPALMLTSSWSATSLGTGYGGRLAAGLRLFDRAWGGPEASAYTDAFSTQYRLGLHLTGLRWQDLEWSGAAGYLQDSYHRRGGYARISVLVRR